MSILEIQDRIANIRGTITVVVNDGTRPSPASYLAELKSVLQGRVRFLFATGTHRAVTDFEASLILGDCDAGNPKAESNMCDDGTHIKIGTTSRGTVVEMHPWMFDGPVLAINTVEPHYFAGFTGGRKSFLPGVSSRKTVVQNHFLACSEQAQPGRLAGNPVHEDMMEGAALLAARTEIIMINGVSGSDTVFCGGYDSSFYKAADVAANRCGVVVREKYSSLEVRPGKSLEVSLYQSMKAIFMWHHAVQDGGELVLASSCFEGLGAKQMESLLLATASLPVIPKSHGEYVLGDHAAIRLHKIRNRIRLSFRTGLDMRRFGFENNKVPIETVIENAGFVFPVMET